MQMRLKKKNIQFLSISKYWIKYISIGMFMAKHYIFFF